VLRRVGRYQKGNQNPYIEEKETTQWPNKKGQKDKQRTTKHTNKTEDRVTRTPLKTGGELRCSERVSSSSSTSGTPRVNLVTNPVIFHEWGKDRKVFTTSGRSSKCMRLNKGFAISAIPMCVFNEHFDAWRTFTWTLSCWLISQMSTRPERNLCGEQQRA
jgi:hypothetical protein